jgi:GyrI-like small molecule binding domain
MNYDVRLEQTNDRPLAVVRRRASLPELRKIVPNACGAVDGLIRAQKLTGTGRLVALYRDDEINLEVGVELEVPFAGTGELFGSAIPGGPVAGAVHFGAYDQLHLAHKAIRKWCADHGHALAGPNWEIYDHWKSEWNTDPSKIRTEVFYLLRADNPSAG